MDNFGHSAIWAALKRGTLSFLPPKKVCNVLLQSVAILAAEISAPSLSGSLKKCATYPCKTLLNNLEVNDIIELEQIEQYRTDN